MSELLKPCIVTTYNLKEKRPFFFNSIELEKNKRDFFIKDVARSTSAAPTYFSPAVINNLITGEEMVNIDGGVFANNPVMCAYAECRDSDELHVERPKAEDMLILSIGTGGGQFMLPELNDSWGLVKWAHSVPEIMMDGSIDTVAYQMKHLIHTLEEKDRVNYKRIDVPETKRKYSSDMSDASEGNIEKLEIAAKEALDDAQKDRKHELVLDEFIKKLIENSPKNEEISTSSQFSNSL